MNDKVILSDIDWNNVIMEPLETTGDYEPAEIHDKPPKVSRIQIILPILKLAFQVFILILILVFAMGMATVIKSIQNGDTPPFDQAQLSVIGIACIMLTLIPMLLRIANRFG